MDNKEHPQFESPIGSNREQSNMVSQPAALPDDMFGEFDPVAPAPVPVISKPVVDSVPNATDRKTELPQIPATDSVQQPMMSEQPVVMPVEASAPEASQLNIKRIMIIAAVILSIIALLAAGWALLQLLGHSVSEQTDPVIEQQIEAIEVPEIGSDSVTEQVEKKVVTDTDGDGLTDDQEREYGTSPIKIDTDNDGLTDREEKNIYNTKPTVSDTDGDGFLDGEEVKNFFNPNGPGTLVDQLEAFNQKESETTQ